MSINYKAVLEDVPLTWRSSFAIAPHIQFPWDTLHPDLAESLKQLARSCASTPESLPGVAFAVAATCVGRIVSIAPKGSWQVPAIVWHGDVRDSGEGKSAPISLLTKPLVQMQEETVSTYESEKELYEQVGRKEKGEIDASSYECFYLTSLTIEGLQASLKKGNGGMLLALDELSAFINGQGQFKVGKGTDREACIQLWGGNSISI